MEFMLCFVAVQNSAFSDSWNSSGSKSSSKRIDWQVAVKEKFEMKHKLADGKYGCPVQHLLIQPSLQKHWRNFSDETSSLTSWTSRLWCFWSSWWSARAWQLEFDGAQRKPALMSSQSNHQTWHVSRPTHKTTKTNFFCDVPDVLKKNLLRRIFVALCSRGNPMNNNADKNFRTCQTTNLHYFWTSVFGHKPLEGRRCLEVNWRKGRMTLMPSWWDFWRSWAMEARGICRMSWWMVVQTL